ncbi:MAG TPA: oligopeptide transporter, OPT family [Steroidobacteraceae bacterium]|nr:oligopeptide transporter, OPT family [Steroidobacteraceae bacterium]
MSDGRPELTLRAIVLGGLITVAFTAANVYLGLKVGLTFATSIPAAVISMAVLRLFKSSSIVENNIVQTVASAAGTLAAIIFVLPGLVIVGWWHHFPYWMTMAATGLGGILGVMFSVPLRRALVVNSDLPYPEGLAAAEVLLVGDQSRDGHEESRQGLVAITVNAAVSAAFFALSQTRLAVDEAAVYFRVGASSTGVSSSLSMALFGVGHLVGISVGMAMFTGIVIAWGILLPVLTAGLPTSDSAQHAALAIFHTDIRFFGAGVIGVAALWTFSRILGPIVTGLKSAMAASAARGVQGLELPLVERDLPIKIVGAVTAASLALIALLLWQFIAGGPLAGHAPALIAATVVFVLVCGLIIASITGYMAGLIGASNSPVSGVGILGVVAAALMLMAIVGRGTNPDEAGAMVAFALFATGIVFGIATISNDNLQDLKTGQLVGATPWRQQAALVFGVIFGSLIIPPVLDLLNTAYGFAGTPGARPEALAAPQAALISALAQGMLGGHLNLRMLEYGALGGALLIAADALLGRAGRMRLPPLAIGLGIYLPMAATLPVVIGAVAGYFYDRWADRRPDPAFARRMGVLMATGMIVGESLFGVLYAGIVVVSGRSAPFTLVGDSFATPALIGGSLLFFGLVGLLYRRTMIVVSRPTSR